ncbi:MAG TPA: recombinase family protein [Acidothermaceae bacterium]
MKAIIYTRQSVDRDLDELAVTRQREACERLAADRGWQVVEVVVDNDVSASGRKPRPGFLRILRAIDAAEVDVVIVWEIDRLVRKLTDLEDVIARAEKTGVRIATASGDLDLSTDAGRLTGRILASVARGEVERKSKRQRAASEQAARAGRRVGGRRPFGYDQDGMTVRPTEAAAVVGAFDAMLAGSGLGEIARTLNSAGHVSGQGSPWRRDSVRQMLTNPRYAGLRALRRVVVGPALWPALISESTWLATEALLADPTRRTAPTGAKALLTAVARCGVCGATVHAGGTTTGHRSYRCSGSTGHVGRRGDVADAYVGDVVVARLSRKDARDLLVNKRTPNLAKLQSEAIACRSRLETLALDFADGTLTAPQLRAATGRLRERLAAVEGQMADAGRVDVLGPLVDSPDVRAAWERLSTDRQRGIIDVLMTVTLMPPGRGVRVFNPDSVRIEWRTG